MEASTHAGSSEHHVKQSGAWRLIPYKHPICLSDDPVEQLDIPPYPDGVFLGKSNLEQLQKNTRRPSFFRNLIALYLRLHGLTYVEIGAFLNISASRAGMISENTTHVLERLSPLTTRAMSSEALLKITGYCLATCCTKLSHMRLFTSTNELLAKQKQDLPS